MTMTAPDQAPAERSAGSLWVYDNRVHKFARVHRSECTFCQGGRGLHDRGSRAVAGGWLGPFLTWEEALAAATRTGRDVSTCSVCTP